MRQTTMPVRLAAETEIYFRQSHCSTCAYAGEVPQCGRLCLRLHQEAVDLPCRATCDNYEPEESGDE